MLLRRAGRYAVAAGPRLRRTPSWRRSFGGTAKLLAGALALLLAARLALPYALRRSVDATLDRIEGCRGRVEKVRLFLWRGAYRVEGLELFQEKGGLLAPFFAAESLELSVDWGALLDGTLAARLTFERPSLNFIKGPTPERSQLSIGADWRRRLQELTPLRIDRVDLVDGRISYQDLQSRPPIDLSLDDIDASARELSGRRRNGRPLPAALEATALAAAQGRVGMNLRLDPAAARPSFALRLSLSGLPLARIDELLEALGGFDTESGRFDLFLEASAADGGYKGELRPVYHELRLAGERDWRRPLLRRAWNAFVGSGPESFETQKPDRLAARIPLAGAFVPGSGDGVWTAVPEVLRAALARALLPGLAGPPGANKDK